jgi:hypothetical protein
MVFLRSTKIDRAHKHLLFKARPDEISILPVSRVEAFLHSLDPQATSPTGGEVWSDGACIADRAPLDRETKPT